VQVQPGHRRPGCGRNRAGMQRGLRGGEPARSVQELCGDRQRARRHGGRVHPALNPDMTAGAEHVRGPGEHVRQEDLRHDAQRRIPVDAPRLQIVHRPRPPARAVGRHRQAPRIHDQREHVIAVGQVTGQLDRPGKVTALVAAERRAVQHRSRGNHDAAEVGEHPAASEQRAVQVPPVDPHFLPRCRIPSAPRQRHHRVRQRHRAEAAVVIVRIRRAAGIHPAEQPALIELIGARPQRHGRRIAAGHTVSVPRRGRGHAMKERGTPPVEPGKKG
jgi:hypothetical protein